MSFRAILQRLVIISTVFIVFLSVSAYSELPAGYTGLPFRNQIQSIPGVIYTWRYDSAGAEITWHTSDRNQGTCHLRKTGTTEDLISLKYLDTYWDHMSPGAGSDTMIHYTDSNNIYLGYIVTGEWVKMTINATQAGTYQFDAMVTACCDPASTTECINPICDPTIKIDFLNGADSVSTGPVTLTKTGYYHHYMYEANLARVTLKQGTQLHKITILGTPPANLWYFKYTLLSTPAMERQRHFGALDELRTEQVAHRGNDGILVTFRAAAAAPVELDVFDARGKLLGSEQFSNVVAGLNRSTIAGYFAPGTHIVKLAQGSRSTVSKVVIGGR
jgi:hypothetical protein